MPHKTSKLAQCQDALLPDCPAEQSGKSGQRNTLRLRVLARKAYHNVAVALEDQLALAVRGRQGLAGAQRVATRQRAQGLRSTQHVRQQRAPTAGDSCRLPVVL